MSCGFVNVRCMRTRVGGLALLATRSTHFERGQISQFSDPAKHLEKARPRNFKVHLSLRLSLRGSCEKYVTATDTHADIHIRLVLMDGIRRWIRLHASTHSPGSRSCEGFLLALPVARMRGPYLGDVLSPFV
jgi:hypothetical protein